MIATASPQYHEAVRKLGATHVINYRDADVVEQIKKHTNDSLTLAYDTAGAASAQSAFDALSSSLPAKLALIASGPEEIKGLADAANKSAERLFGSSYAHLDLSVPFWKSLSGWLKDGKVVPQTTRVLGGLDAVVAGQEEQIAGKVSSQKLIVKPFSTK